MKSIDIKSPAKINLYLKVLAKNDDGYHDIDTSFQLIDLCDNMSFQKIEKGITIKSNLSFLENEDNTILESAMSLLDLTHGKFGVDITIHKNIPIGAGLGGGSSNAASTIVALNKLWGLGLSHNKLVDIGLKIGADVPFFLHGNNAYGKGIGDLLRSRDSIEDKILLIDPKINNSSKKMFHMLDSWRGKNKHSSKYKQNNFWELFIEANKEIKEFYNITSLEYDLNLSGSGSCMFITYQTKKDIEEILKKIPSNWRFFFCKPLQYSPICYIK